MKVVVIGTRTGALRGGVLVAPLFLVASQPHAGTQSLNIKK